MLDHEKKVEREQREAREKKEKAQATLNILNWQTETRKQTNDWEKDNKLKEQQQLKDKWQSELDQEK